MSSSGSPETFSPRPVGLGEVCLEGNIHFFHLLAFPPFFKVVKEDTGSCDGGDRGDKYLSSGKRRISGFGVSNRLGDFGPEGFDRKVGVVGFVEGLLIIHQRRLVDVAVLIGEVLEKVPVVTPE